MHALIGTVLMAAAALPAVQGHSWIEQVRVVNSDGRYVGEYGYPRGFVSKTQPGYDGEKSMVYLLPPAEAQPPFIDSTHKLCHPNQRKQVQSDKFPRVKATAGGWLSLRYAENGHVSNPSHENGHIPGTLDPQRRENGGSVFVYGTTEPIEEETIANVLQWTKDGQGGDKRGVLLAVNDYDDGRCYEDNPVNRASGRMDEHPNYVEGQVPQGAAANGPGNFPLMCETNVELPKDAPNGKPYALYWVWQWPMDADPKSKFFPKGKDEYYTTCLDVDIVDVVKEDVQMQYALAPQDAMSVAVRTFTARKALITNAMEGEVGPVFSNIPAPTGGVPPPSQGTALPSAPFSSAPPFSNSTVAVPIPTLTSRPGEDPAPAPTAAPPVPPVEDGIVTVIVTERITVTAPVEAPAETPIPAKRDAHEARHAKGAKFRRGTYFKA